MASVIVMWPRYHHSLPCYIGLVENRPELYFARKERQALAYIYTEIICNRLQLQYTDCNICHWLHITFVTAVVDLY